MVEKERALELIQESVEGLIRGGIIEESFVVENGTVLLGMGSPLDSLGFVTFVTDLEERLIDETDNDDLYLTLDEIQGFNMDNPNLTVEIFVDYMTSLTKDQ
jgi:hypothetical protein